MVEVLMTSDLSEKHKAFKAHDEAKIEQRFLKGIKDVDLGVYCDMFSAKTSFEGQDGGVVTALLAKGFREGSFDSAIVVRRMEGYTAEAAVAQNVEEATLANSTKYLRVDVTQKLRELINQGKKRIAIVCTPCQAKTVRKIQQTLAEDCQMTVIGLFCFEAFHHGRLKEAISSHTGIDIDKAQKTQVRHGRFILQVDGKKYSCSVKDLECAAEKACGLCDDFTSQFADVSVGSVGSKAGYSTVIVRSSVGEKLVRKLDAIREEADKLEVVRLVKFKRERSKKAFTKRGRAA